MLRGKDLVETGLPVRYREAYRWILTKWDRECFVRASEGTAWHISFFGYIHLRVSGFMNAEGYILQYIRESSHVVTNEYLRTNEELSEAIVRAMKEADRC